MSNSNQIGDIEEKLEHTFTSGHPGTTGREPFEEDAGSIPPGQHNHHHHGTTGATALAHDLTSGGNNRDIGGGQRYTGGQTSTGGEGYSSGQGVGASLTGGAAGSGGDNYSSQGGLGRAGQGQGYTDENAARSATAGGLSGSGYDGSGETGHHHHSHTGEAAGAGAAGAGLTGLHRHQEGEGGISGEGPHDAAQYTAAKYGKHTLKEGYGDSYGSSPAGNTSGGYNDNQSSTTGQSGYDSLDKTGSNVGDSYGANSASQTADRVGNRGENSALYERTTDKGPITGGAAGTDRFDSDRSHTGTGTGSHSTSGVSDGGLLGKTDDFTGRDRDAAKSGAYSDSHGAFQGNTSGPGSNSALTGREGDASKNPVASGEHAAHGAIDHADKSTTAEKPGFIQKIKELL